MRDRAMRDSIGLMLRSSPCPQGEVSVSKHEAAPHPSRPVPARARTLLQDEVGAAHVNTDSFLSWRLCASAGMNGERSFHYGNNMIHAARSVMTSSTSEATTKSPNLIITLLMIA